MSMNPEQLGEVVDFVPNNRKETEEEKKSANFNLLNNIEMAMTGIFIGKVEEGQKNQEQLSLDESALPIELVANPNEMENPPEEDDRKIRDETGPSLRAVRIDAGSPTGQELPIYEVDTGEMAVEEPTLVNEILEPVNKAEGVELEKQPIEENPVVAEMVKEEPVKEEPAKEGSIEEEDELSARRTARAQLEKMTKLRDVNSQLLAAEARRAQLENLANRNAA